ncbi:unnamed protein product [Ectocarpus sp. 4 AP-2014]
MLPLLKKRAAKPRVLLAALSRYNNKQDGAFLYLPGKNVVLKYLESFAQQSAPLFLGCFAV